MVTAVKTSVGVDYGEYGACFKIQQLMEELELLTKQLESLETEMEKALKKTEVSEYLLSISGMGVVSLAMCLGELGNPLRFEDARQMSRLAGYNLIEDSSEKIRVEHVYQSGAEKICEVCCIRFHLLWWQTIRNCDSSTIS